MKAKKFSHKIEITSHVCDKNKNLRIVSLFNIFQDLATASANELGVGLDYCNNMSMTWVGTKYHVKINRLPKLGENIIATSWPSGQSALIFTRDFLLSSEQGEVLVEASSQWVMIDLETRKPIPAKKFEVSFEPLDERALDSSFEKIAQPQREDFVVEFLARFDDVDVNNHVNNSVYPLWATESVSCGFHANNVPCEMEVAFKKETTLGQKVVVFCQQNGQETLHQIVLDDDKKELAQVRILWKQI